MDDQPFPNALSPGTRVGPVVLDRAIGQGAWGIVYEGRHDTWGHVAVKEYFPTTYASRATRGSVSSSAPQWQDAVRRGLERFGQEGRALKSIRHENVVPVYEYLENDGAALLVMEFVEGRTLSAAYEAGQFHDAESVMALGATLIDTLQAVHQKNVLHRDIAPDNIMIRADGSPVLIDFGGAAAAIASATRSTNNVVKDGYSPPEQYDTSANPSFPVGPWSDVYATAAVLYRLAAGREPAVSNARLLAAGSRSGGDPLTPLATLAPAGYPKEWLAGVDSGLALLPKDRPQSAAEWRKRFEKVATRRSVSPVMVGVVAAVAAVAAVFGGTRLLHPAPAAVVAQATTAPSPRPSAKPKPRPAHAAARPAQHPRATQVIVQQPVVMQQQPVVVQQQPAVVQQQVPAVKRAAVQVAAHAPAAKTAATGPVVGLTAEPPAVDAGGSVRLCVSAKNAARVELRSAEGGVISEGPGCRTITPSATGDYTAVAYGAGGVSVTGHARVSVREVAAATLPAAVTVTPAPAATVKAAVPTLKPAVPVVVKTIAPAPIPVVVADACASGYVWRQAIASDHVCVTPAER
ncbi:MAG TPA: serine/threonine-protein kinase, partial [Candidatus Elarobacter sp.]